MKKVTIFGSRYYMEQIPSINITVGDCSIPLTNSVYYLGAYCDSPLNMVEFIKNCKVCKFQIHKMQGFVNIYLNSHISVSFKAW